jgi:hypothetical protein
VISLDLLNESQLDAASLVQAKREEKSYAEELSFPEVVRRCYERAIAFQRILGKIVGSAKVDLPNDDACICICGSVSRLECVKDSDVDYVLIWNDLDGPPSPSTSNSKYRENRRKAIQAVREINRGLVENALRPCNSFSSQRPLSELIKTENLFSRYSIISLVDSSPVTGSESSYGDSLKIIRDELSRYAIGISADHQVIRALRWYVEREGWMDQLHYGTSVNRFSRLIQLFTTILSINEFGIEDTRETKTTWLRIERLEPFLPRDLKSSLEKLWIKALELKENRDSAPMLGDSGFTGISQVVSIWKYIQSLSSPPVT